MGSDPTELRDHSPWCLGTICGARDRLQTRQASPLSPCTMSLAPRISHGVGWGEHLLLKAQLLAGLVRVGAIPVVTADRKPLVGGAGVHPEQGTVPVKPHCGTGQERPERKHCHRGIFSGNPIRSIYAEAQECMEMCRCGQPCPSTQHALEARARLKAGQCQRPPSNGLQEAGLRANSLEQQ